ncbi:restriction system-associated AAA family ATPase [Dyadobacter sp.]|uniref:restriction system-associated AAA family ATPase n=1 Tax=Dyadobacter sp. TaxID=1914288 RepID=UPI003F730171
MKLISVKILGSNFRSLAANRLYEFNHTIRPNRLSTKVFAGLNGSGKSNFLELFSEIFYFLEICHLNTVPDTEKTTRAFGFEIEYLLPETAEEVVLFFVDEIENEVETYIRNNLPLTKLTHKGFEKKFAREINTIRTTQKNKYLTELWKGDYVHVHISKQLNEAPKYSLLNRDTNIPSRDIKQYTGALLPKKIIAYTSGQNELLSNPYYKLKYHYFKTYEDRRIDAPLADNHRLYFLDYSTNFSIFVSNILLADKRKANMLKDVLQISELQAFRITLNTDELYQKVIPVNDALAANLERIKLCATTWIEKKVDAHNLLILDFLINEEVKNAFGYHFRDAFTLFKLFYELEIFNLYLVEKKTRDLMLQVHRSYNLSDEMSKPEPSRLVFRIEQIRISKQIDASKPPRNIYYKSLSDGEHQFNEVIGTVLMMEQEGCLFLIDEPDTHFNPKWRAKLIKMLNYMAATAIDSKGNIEKVRKQEVILTTHSPFVISDSITEDVYRFTKINGIIVLENPTIKTYGTSITILLDEIFEKEETISEMAKKELKEMVDNITTLEGLRKVVDRLNTEFGDSVEKFDLFSRLRTIKEEIEQKGT